VMGSPGFFWEMENEQVRRPKADCQQAPMSANWPELPRGKGVFVGVGLLFLLLWLAARAYAIYPLLYSDPDRPRLSGADSYFHLRHSEDVARNYPLVSRIDRMSNFPYPERGLNQGGYDVLVATLGKLTFGVLSPRQILTWLAPLLTGLSALMLAVALVKRESLWCGLLFLLLVLCFPGPLSQIASLGNGDHHGWEVFLQTLLLLSLTWALQDRCPVRYSVLPALVLLLFFFSWAGSPLHLFFTGACFFAWALVDHEPEARPGLVKKGLFVGAMLVLIPVAVDHFADPLIIWDRALQIYLLGGGALMVGFPPLVLLSQRLPFKRRVAASLILLVAVVLTIRLVPILWGEFEALISRRSSTIAEHVAVTPGVLFAWYGLTPFSLLLSPVLLWREGRIRPYLIPLVYGFGITFFWIYTRDFNYYAPLIVAGASAYCLSRLPWRGWTPAALILVAGISVLPLPNQARPWLLPSGARELVLHSNGIEQASRFLASVKDQNPGEYGLLAPWDLGNVLAYTTKTGVAYSQTHSPSQAKLFYLKAPDQVYRWMKRRKLRFILIPARNIEQKLATDYSLTGRNPVELMKKGSDITWEGRTFNLPDYNESVQRLFIVQLFDGLAKDLGHFRLVFESPQQVVRAQRLTDDLENFSFMALEVSPQEAEALGPLFKTKNTVYPTSRGLLVNAHLGPEVRVFERVPGALIVGKTSRPQAPVGAYISLSSPASDKPYILTWRGLSDSLGNFELRLPYATKRAVYDLEGSVVVNSNYRVECDGKTYEVEVTEEQVQAETRISVEQFPEIAPAVGLSPSR